MTGNSRACSSSALTAGAAPPALDPGRVLSAPRSSKSRLLRGIACSGQLLLLGQKSAAVAERVRRDIHHTHHERPPTQLERARTQTPVQNVPHKLLNSMVRRCTISPVKLRA